MIVTSRHGRSFVQGDSTDPSRDGAFTSFSYGLLVGSLFAGVLWLAL